MNNANNVQTLDTSTVEFTNSGEIVIDGATQTPPEIVIVVDAKAETFEQFDGGNSAYAALLQRNELFESSGQAIAAFKAWQVSDKFSMAFIDRAVKEALTKYGMHKEPEKANASPLTHAVKAFEHRGKRNLASKLIAFIQAVTNYKWDVKKDAFRLKKDKAVNTSFTPEQQAIYDAPFYDYAKPTKKADWEFQKALTKVLEKAEREGVAVEERAKVMALLAQGIAPKVVDVPEIRNDLKTDAHHAKVDEKANDKDAA